MREREIPVYGRVCYVITLYSYTNFYEEKPEFLMKNKFSELISQKPTKYIYVSMSRSYPEYYTAIAVFFI